MRRPGLRSLTLGLTLALGVGLLAGYTGWLLRQDLREWQEIRVVFPDVGGLEVDDEVEVKGARMGRVGEIRLYHDEQLVVLEVEPDLVLPEDGIRFEIVPKNALGGVAVRITPGESGPRVSEEELYEGQFSQGILARAEPSGDRVDEAGRQIRELADLTDALTRPDGGAVGSLLNDPDRKVFLADQLEGLADLWERTDRSLARVERGDGAGAVLVSQDALLSVGETARSVRETLGGLRDGLRAADRRRGAGRFLSDPVEGARLREALAHQGRYWRATRRGEGLLGRLAEPDVHEALARLADRTRATTADAVEGRGLLGVLSAPRFEQPTRRLFRGLDTGLEGVRRSPAVSSPEARRSVEDAMGNADDLLNNLERALVGIRRNLPARSSLHGAVFAVF